MDPRRRLLLAALGPAWPAAAPAATAGAGETTIAPRELVFPRDFGSHPAARIEWWYITGVLRGEGREFGFQVTFFRSRTELAAGHPSRFAAQQLIFAHAALTDLAGARLRHDQRVARSGFGLAEADEADTALRLRDWTLRREGEPGDARQRSRYRTRVASDSAGFAFELDLDTTQPLLLQGEAGWSQKGPSREQASHYYSQPQLAVRGRLRLDGRELAVDGRAWLDHEWSDALMAPEAVGWDWIGMNLDDGGALTAFRLRRADGSALWHGGSHRPAGGAVRAFGPDELRFEAGRRWRSPATQAEYPVAWQLASPLGRLQVQARLDAQELDSRASTGSVYWEGLSRLLDAAGRPIGQGYLEMTGYHAPLQLGARTREPGVRSRSA